MPSRPMRVRTAPIWLRPFMKLCRFQGWASFWRVAYVLPGYESDQKLIRHELKHLEQIERDGRLVFSIKYLWWLLRYGYCDNPYEVEARKAETLNDLN